jgi:hypothetical protein
VREKKSCERAGSISEIDLPVELDDDDDDDGDDEEDDDDEDEDEDAVGEAAGLKNPTADIRLTIAGGEGEADDVELISNSDWYDKVDFR